MTPTQMSYFEKFVKRTKPIVEKIPHSLPSERAKLRPKNFKKLHPELQWQIDKSLGILDWNGK